MTLHIFYSHQCPQCEAHYIPYDTNVPCPKCGHLEAERFDYIPQAADSIEFNLRSYGSYVPPAWYTGSLGDHILLILFGVFERYRENGAGVSFDVAAKADLEQMQWGDQTYLRDHIEAIAVRVYDEIQKRK